MKWKHFLLTFFLFPLSLMAVSKDAMARWYNSMNILVHQDSMEALNSDLGVHFLGGTKFPIGSLTSLMAQWGGRGASLTSLTECADIISMEKVSDFLRDVLTSVLTRAESLRNVQVDPEAIQKYIDNLESIRQDLNHKQNSNYQRMTVKNEQIRFLLEIDRSWREQVRGDF